MALIAAHLNAGIILVVTSVATSIKSPSPLHTPLLPVSNKQFLWTLSTMFTTAASQAQFSFLLFDWSRCWCNSVGDQSSLCEVGNEWGVGDGWVWAGCG